ncbi:hypothetical protein QUF94_21650 [Peribacillus sp. NJ4]|uniref:hypothetical protein n=1 Tax=unclassified Peribacillus TaxID=2675266 RepID=UPI0025A23B25|nr:MULTISPECIES: hypothetical protein [unclassified Peribacillus]MDM5214010.1 hypothetical protein [Peribacillus sp. NJ4]MDM5219333.1 hypothetical protein [Peribacillus sp. NJ11]
MTKKAKMSVLITAAILIGGILLFVLFPKEPEPFLSEKQIIKRINSIFPEAQPKSIQNKIFLDDTHVFVPFISEENGYGMSFWVWKGNKWKAASVNMGGQPQVWNGEEKSLIMWNMNTKDDVSEIGVFMKVDRDFLVEDGIATYQPGIEMMHSIALKGKTYGVARFPDNWRELMKQYVKLQAEDGQNDFPDFNDPIRLVTNFHDKEGEEIIPEHSFNGNSYTTGYNFVDVHFLVTVQEEELEGAY